MESTTLTTKAVRDVGVRRIATRYRQAKHQLLGQLWTSRPLTRHVQDGVRFVRVLFQLFDGVGGWKHDQCDLATFRFAFQVVHHGQPTRSSADDETTTFPRDLLSDGNWRVSKLIAKFLRRFLLTFMYVPAVDDHVVVLIRHAVNSDGTKREFLEAHIHLPHKYVPSRLNKSWKRAANRQSKLREQIRGASQG